MSTIFIPEGVEGPENIQKWIDLHVRLDECQAEIERLRAALRQITETDPAPIGDWFAAWKHLAFKLKGIARTALEQNDD